MHTKKIQVTALQLVTKFWILSSIEYLRNHAFERYRDAK